MSSRSLLAAGLASLCLLGASASAAVITAITLDSAGENADPAEIEAARATLRADLGHELLISYAGSDRFMSEPNEWPPYQRDSVGWYSEERLILERVIGKTPQLVYWLSLTSHAPCASAEPAACPRAGFPALEQLRSEAGFSFAPENLETFHETHSTLGYVPALGRLTGDVDLTGMMTGAVPVEDALGFFVFGFDGSEAADADFELRVDFAPVPLPASGLLFLSGTVLLAARRLRLRRGS